MAEPHASAALPLYLQVAAALRDDLTGRRVAPGSRLPSERSLVDRFQVNRQTVRSALRLLRDEGLVVTDRRGTYAAASDAAGGGPGPVLAPGLLEFPSGRSGRDRPAEAALTWEAPPAETAGLLGLLPGESSLVHRQRVFGADGSVERHAVSRFSRYALAEVPELGRYRRSEARVGRRPDLRLLYHWMHRAGLRLTRRESIGVRAPAATACLTVHREVHDQHGHVLEVTDIRFAPESAPLTYEFTG
ncbi:MULTISPECIES: GntR family transcriptional regulator [Streptomyces]|uniref:GntR family transcriptional regulator n=2 Tax=Streptomyces TaxID=1883 RepID=A0A117IWJ0_9ACTN|nr:MULTISPECIES: GntR family transcriptional regulator [Streptomyces]KUH38838.1 GntR family transcriptional regulator [Streptomyces kanasensis]UUS29683.1 GntR family transcriptional regulator [Streptomyces changanensis]